MENAERLSRLLSKVLRHKAEEYGIAIQADGFVKVSDLLAHRDFRWFSLEDVVQVVNTNDKKRFELFEVHGDLKIRAVQGHSLRNIEDSLLLTLITDPSDLPVALHGTNRNALPSIMANGLDRMSRNHIHLAVGTPDEGVTSGMRRNAKVIIHIDVIKAMADGVRFYRSENGVVLTRGLNDSGILPPTYFKNVEKL